MQSETRFSILNKELAEQEKTTYLKAHGLEVERINAHPDTTWRVWDPKKLPDVNMIGDDALDQGVAYLDRLLHPLNIDELLAQGGQQMSRKYRHVARLPPNMTALEALRTRAPEHYASVMRRAEEWAAHEYRLYVAGKFGDSFTLSVEEFNEFLVKTGRKPNTFLETPRTRCTGCGSLGHLHRKDCSEQHKGTPAE